MGCGVVCGSMNRFVVYYWFAQVCGVDWWVLDGVCFVFEGCDNEFGVVDKCVLGVGIGWSCGQGGMCWCELVGLGCMVLELGFVNIVLGGLVGAFVVSHG